MKKTIRRLFLSAITLGAAVTAVAQNYIPQLETLKYRVTYKWGLINKQAGTVTLTTHDFADGMFKSTLVGTSASWADHFYSVRDTLMGTIFTQSLEPVYYEKIAREGGEFKRDVITYERSGSKITANCLRQRQKKASAPVEESTVSLEGTGISLDMLSSFYYMRHIDYPAMKPGESVTMNIFSGRRKELLKITYIGEKTVNVDDVDYNCFYIKFSFTGDGGKKTSDDIFAWISRDTQRIPVMLLGNLPIGSIRCYYQQ